jgi:integration host factor subunit beta
MQDLADRIATGSAACQGLGIWLSDPKKTSNTSGSTAVGPGVWNMNKLELIEALKEQTNISKAESKKVVEMFFATIADSMAKGERVEIRGLFAFKIKCYDSYNGRNPKTGEPIRVKDKKLPFFKAGTDLSKRVDE